MSSLLELGDSPHRSLRVAVLAAVLGVAGCFTAAFTFADQPVQAAEVEQRKRKKTESVLIFTRTLLLSI